MQHSKLTPEEKSAIAALKRLQKKWPSSLWIFAGGNEALTVIKTRDGERVIDGNGSPDQEFVVDQVSIPSDGGAW